MIPAIIKPPAEYGLFETYSADPQLFQLITLQSYEIFSWELECNVQYRTISSPDLYQAVLDCGADIESPITYKLWLASQQEVEPLARLFGNLEKAKLIAELRWLQWKKHFRGVLGVKGNVFHTRFNPGLDDEEKKYLDQSLEIVKNQLNHGG